MGGFITGFHGAKPAIILDTTTQVAFGPLTSGGHQFLGVIDASPAGFTRFEVRELDGKIGQALYIWADDVTLSPIIADGDLAPRGNPARPSPDFGLQPASRIHWSLLACMLYLTDP